MGILNVTPDSFSDGGQFLDTKSAVSHALRMVEQGADIIDIGGESTRPGSDPISINEELARVIPVIKGIRGESTIQISIDTYKSKVARAAMAAGANIINDISGLNFDQEMVNTVRDHRVPIVIMHIKGTPKNMQIDPQYDDLIKEVIDYFKKQIDFCRENGKSSGKLNLYKILVFAENNKLSEEIDAFPTTMQECALVSCFFIGFGLEILWK